MLRVGLTGGMGSGKSTVARIFSVLGVPVYDADKAAKRLMQHHLPLKKKLISIFGEDIYSSGTLNRELLSDKVFNDAQLLTKLNDAVHPETIRDAGEWMALQAFPYAIKEAALIFESGSNSALDFVIGVRCPLELKLERITQRDGLTNEAILARMNKQMDDEKKMSLCDAVIDNNEKEPLIPQVLQLHERLMQLATRTNMAEEN